MRRQYFNFWRYKLPKLFKYVVIFFAVQLLLSEETLATSKDSKLANAHLLAELPIHIVDNRVQLDLVVEGYHLKFALDTGASRTVLFQSNNYSFEDLPTIGEAQVAFPALDEIISGITLAPLNIKLGRHAFHAARPLLIKQRPPIGDRLSFKFDGILGRDFFERYVIEVDPKKEILRLFRSGTNLNNRFKTILPLHMKGNTAHIRFRTKLPWENTPSMKDMMLDTGYPGAMVIWKGRHFRQAASASETEQLVRENIGIVTQANFRLSKLRFLHIPVFLAPKEPIQAQRRDGLIGSSILIQFHHVFDFGGGRLLLTGIHETSAQNFYQLESHIYPPNNEGFIVKNYAPPLPTGPGHNNTGYKH